MHRVSSHFIHSMVASSVIFFMSAAVMAQNAGSSAQPAVPARQSAASPAQSAATANPPADIVFMNGVVWTVDDAHPSAQAVAVRDGKIVAVGTDAEIKIFQSASTTVIDLKKK